MDSALPEWLDPVVAGYVAALSTAFVVVSALAAPIVIARLPADYFVRERRPPQSEGRTLLHNLRMVLQNAVGAVLLLAGVAMLVLPGQGILTILAALSLLTFPGKRRLQRDLLRRKAVSRVVEAIRRRAGKPPLQLGDPD
ncbi:MAG: PGPGW domain-containing protein [Myxococcales bacterium]